MQEAEKTSARDKEIELLRAELEKERALRAAAELQLKDERKRFDDILDALPAFIFIKDDKNNVIYINQMAAEGRGLERAEMEGKSCYELYPDDGSKYFEDDQEVLLTGAPKTGIIEQILSRSGEKRWVSTSKMPWQDSQSGRRGVLVVAFDITDIVRQQDQRESLMAAVAKALELSEERYYLAIRGSNDGVWDWNLRTNEVFYSPRYKESLGYRDDEFPNVFDSFRNNLHPDDSALVMERVRAHLEDKVPYEAEFRMRHKNGEWNWFSARGQAIWDKDGVPYRMAGSQRDITDRKQVEQNVNEFFSTVSHELRTPLSAVKGSLRLIEGGLAGQISNESRELLDIALSSCERLIRLVNDILDLRKIEAGKLELQINKECAGDLIDKVLSELLSYADAHGVTLSKSCADNLMLEVDHDRVVQVLTNLVGNAIKFSGSGAQVMVRVEQLRPESIRFAVIDSGPGIPEDQHHLLFMKFKQLDASDSRRQDGTGLGLAICKAITLQHHGSIGVNSRQGEGCEFWFELPVKFSK